MTSSVPQYIEVVGDMLKLHVGKSQRQTNRIFAALDQQDREKSFEGRLCQEVVIGVHRITA